MSKKKNQFPTTLLVTKETERDGSEYFITYKNPQEIGSRMENNIEPVNVAIYKLLSIGELKFLPNWGKIKKVK
jgi:hypothetical protein